MNWTLHYKKAVTFSYDDGVIQDQRLIELMNRYHLKGTFNINSNFNRVTGAFWADHVWVEHFELTELPMIYQDHEVASHSLNHPDLTKFTKEEITREIKEDADNIERIMKIRPRGFAYPYGTYNDDVVSVLKHNGFDYARTIESNHGFDLQTDLLRFHPTCHHNDPDIFKLIDQFLMSDVTEPQLFYLWGHSYEFDVDQNWNHIEDIFKRLSNQPDVFYGTNQDVLSPLIKLESVKK